MSMLKEFREFALKGNVVDLAVGVVIGAAFGTIVSSLVDDMIMPLVGAVSGGLDFSNYFVPLSDAVTATTLDAAREQGAVFAYGKFLTAVLKFVIVAWVLFMVIKAMNSMKRKEEAKPAPVAETPADIKLLTEIRDLLKK
ncbi:MAG: large conductance mechanosensitive channel protein MscL [Hyphomonadaceae bacterium]